MPYERVGGPLALALSVISSSERNHWFPNAKLLPPKRVRGRNDKTTSGAQISRCKEFKVTKQPRFKIEEERLSK